MHDPSQPTMFDSDTDADNDDVHDIRLQSLQETLCPTAFCAPHSPNVVDSGWHLKVSHEIVYSVTGRKITEKRQQ